AAALPSRLLIQLVEAELLPGRHENQRIVPRMRHGEVEIALPRLAHALEGRRLLEGVHQVRVEDAEPLLDGGAHEGVLAVEVAIDRRRRQVTGGRHLAHGEPRDALLEEQIPRGVPALTRTAVPSKWR